MVFWVIPKITPANLCKPMHDIINYFTCICPFKSGKCGKEEEKTQNFEYLENENSFLDKIKNISHSFWRAIIWWKNKNLIKTNHIKPWYKIHNSRCFGFFVLFRPLATNELTENNNEIGQIQKHIRNLPEDLWQSFPYGNKYQLKAAN